MKGLVFSQFIDMVEERFGPDLLERIIAASNLPSGGVYSSLGTYDFEELARLVGNLSSETGLPPGVLIKTFGMHLFGRLVHLYPQFLEGEVSTLGFVPKVENYIHHEVRKLYPDATLPSFLIEESSDDRLIFVYQSARPLSDLAEGMLRGSVEHFVEDVELTRDDLPIEGGGARARFTLIRRPAPQGEDEPASSGEDESASSGEDESASSGEDESASSGEDESASSDEDESASSDEDESASSGEDESASSDEDESASSDGDEPASSDEEEPASSAEDESASPAEDEPASPDEKEPASSAKREPASSAKVEPSAADAIVRPRPKTRPAPAPPSAPESSPAPETWPAPAVLAAQLTGVTHHVETAPPVDVAGLDRTLGYLRDVLLERAAGELGLHDLPGIVRAGAEVERTVSMLRHALLGVPGTASMHASAYASAAAPAATSAAARQQIELLEARLKRAIEVRKASESIAEHKTNELYQAKTEIENALGYLRAILDNMDDGLLVVGLDGDIKLVNRRAQQLFGLEGLELLGMAVEHVFNERVANLVGRCVNHPGTSPQRMDLTSPAGQPLSVVASSIRAGGASKHIGTVMIVRDISAEVEAQKHRSITDMVVGMAHELNTPLGIIKTAVGIISEAARSDALVGIADPTVHEEMEGVIRATELIDGHTTRMGRLIEAFKKLSASQMTEAIVDVDLFELLQEIAEVLVTTDDRLHVTVEADLEPIDRQWLGQPDHLTQVITALLANVTEHAYPAESDTFPVKVTLARDEERDCFVISVRDFGIGMAHEQMLRIFDPFFTSKRGGGGASPGLGLSIVNNLVRAGLRGSIEVSSEVGGGTTFVVVVPLRLA
jgi:PAS domain S-box-containing protein